MTSTNASLPKVSYLTYFNHFLSFTQQKFLGYNKFKETSMRKISNNIYYTFTANTSSTMKSYKTDGKLKLILQYWKITGVLCQKSRYFFGIVFLYR